MEETNEFQKQFKDFVNKLKQVMEQAKKEAEKEAQVTQVIEGEHGRYLIHLN